jgi:cation/acetate symporter
MTDFATRLTPRELEPAKLAQRRAAAGLLAFLAMLAILIFVVETLSQVGVGQTILIWLVATFALAVPGLAAMFAPTASRAEFAVGGRKLSVAASATATAAALFGSVFAIGLAALFFRSEAQMSALALGLCGGLLLSGVLFAPFLRRSAAVSLGGFIEARFGRSACALSAVIAAVALFPMLVAELSIAGKIGGWTLGIGKDASMTALAILMVAPPLIAGIRGPTLAGVLQFALLLVGLAVSSFWVSGYATGFALPLSGYVAAAARLETMNALSSAPPAWDLAGFALCVALGVAALPTLMLRSAATASSPAARASIAWTLFFVAFFAIASASMGAIVRWIIVESPAKFGSIAELVAQPWIVDWVGRDAAFVTLCGETASEAGSACAAGPLKPGDLAIDPDIALLLASEMTELPSSLAMILATACLAAAVSAGSLLTFAIGRSLGNDLLFRALMPRAPASRALFVERLVLLVAAGAALRVASDPPVDYLQLAFASLSLSAAGLFPVLLAAVWWRRANRFGALAGMLAGFAIAFYLAVATMRYPELFAWLEPVGLVDLAKALGVERAALVAVPVGLLLTVVASLLTPRPTAAQRDFTDALQSARDLPAADEIE